MYYVTVYSLSSFLVIETASFADKEIFNKICLNRDEISEIERIVSNNYKTKKSYGIKTGGIKVEGNPYVILRGDKELDKIMENIEKGMNKKDYLDGYIKRAIEEEKEIEIIGKEFFKK